MTVVRKPLRDYDLAGKRYACDACHRDPCECGRWDTSDMVAEAERARQAGYMRERRLLDHEYLARVEALDRKWAR